MKRVFAIDVLECPSCGGNLEPVVEITDKAVARKMLAHVGQLGEDWCEGEPQCDGQKQ